MKFTDTNVAGTIASTSKIACETASQKGYTTPDGIADASKKIAHFNPAIVGLTGGGSTKLDGITTVGVDVGMVQLVVIGDVADYYKLTAGVAIEGSPSIILPDDYNAGTNAKSWVLQSVGDRDITSGDISFAGVASKTTPVDADTIPMLDSEASGAWKLLSWSNIKATLKAYFDTFYVALSQLSTTGGANKVLQLDADGKFRTMPVNPTAGVNPGNPWRLAAEQRFEFEDYAGSTVASMRIIPNHGDDFNEDPYPELFYQSYRHCFYWNGGFQIGDADAARGFRYLYFNSLGIANGSSTLGGTLDGTRESIAVQFRGSKWNGSAAQASQASVQYVPAGVKSGELGFWIGGPATPAGGQMSPGGTSAYGRILESSGNIRTFGITENGIRIPAGKSIYFEGDGSSLTSASGGGVVTVASGGTGSTTGSLVPTGNWTVTQNSVPVIQSDESGAKTNSIRIFQGKVRVGTSQSTATVGHPFEVKIPGVGDESAPEFYVDSNGTVSIGRLSITGGNSTGRLVVQSRDATLKVDINCVTGTHTFLGGTVNNGSINNFTNTTDSTSSTTGSAKFSGGVGIAKKLFVGEGITFSPAASATPASNGQLTFEATSNTSVTIKLKGSDGTVRSIVLTLA
jgi:hypothetical protein